MLAKFRSWRDVTGCQRGSRSWYAPLSLRDARPARNEKHIEVRRCRRMSPVSRVPPSRDDPRPRKPRSRPSAMMSRSFERRTHRCYFSGGSSTTVARVSRGAGSTRARRARAGSPENPPDSRDRAAGRPRGPIRRARGRDTCHDRYPTLRWTLVFSSPFLHRPRARETRDAPSTAEARLARRRRVPRVSRAIPRRPPHRHPVADRSHPRAPLPRPRCQLIRPRGSSGVSRRIAIRNASRAREACLGIFPTHS